MLPANATQTVLRGTDVVPIVLSHGNAKDSLALLLATNHHGDEVTALGSCGGRKHADQTCEE